MVNNKIINDILKNNFIFRNINDADFNLILHKLSYTIKNYSQYSIIFSTGDKVDNIGIILSGKINIVKYDFWGNKFILRTCTNGDIFGENFALSSNKISSVSVETVCNDTEILFLNISEIIRIATEKNYFNLIENIVTSICETNIFLTKHLEILSQKNTTEKLMMYLSDVAKHNGTDTFSIPLNRQELSEYLAVDRAGLSVILSKLQKEKILKYDKNKFTLLKKLL